MRWVQGEIENALKMAETLFAGLLSKEENLPVMFRLRCQQFIELIRNKVGGRPHQVTPAQSRRCCRCLRRCDCASLLLLCVAVQANTDEALRFAQEVLSVFRMGDRAQQTTLWEVTALLAYEKPESSPLAHYLETSFVEGTADTLNVAVLAHLGAPQHSPLEFNLKQLVVTHNALRQAAGSKGPLFKLPL